MDAFWGPLMIYGGLVVAGIIIAAIGVPWSESHDRDKRQIAGVFLTLGGAVGTMGAGGIAIKLLGELIEAIF